MQKSDRHSRDPALIGIEALGFIAADSKRLQRFLMLTGITPEDLRRRAGEGELLAAVLDHLLEDEALLFLFAEAQKMHPAEVVTARRALPGLIVSS